MSSSAPAGDCKFRPPEHAGDLGMLGPYRIQKRIGRGGMGAVYLGFDPGLERRAAIKTLLPRFAADPMAKERFLREARTAAKVKSDHVVTIFQVGEDAGTPYLAMEYLEGIPLDQYLLRKGAPPLSHILRIARETAAGLAAAHALGLVHRDIKPANLWLEAPSGRVKILDFGLARQVTEDIHLTRSGAVLGTPAYMSPEQARAEELDGRSDLFSLGVVMYRLTTGKQPFEGPTVMSTLLALTTNSLIPVRNLNPNVPAAVAELIQWLLEKRKEGRPQSAKEVLAALQALEAAGKAGTAPKPPLSGSRPVVPAFVVVEEDDSVADMTEEDAEEPAGGPKSEARKKKHKSKKAKSQGGSRKGFAIAAGAILAIALVAVITLVATRKKSDPPAPTDADAKAPPPAPPATPPGGTPRPTLAAGGRLSPIALVTSPAKLPGVRSWSVEPLGVQSMHASPAISADGKSLALSDGLVRILDLRTLLPTSVLVPPAGAAQCADWGPSGSGDLAIVARRPGGADQSLTIFDTKAGRPGRSYPLVGSVARIAWSPNGKMMAIGYGVPPQGTTLAPPVGSVAVLDLKDGKEIGRFACRAPVHLRWSPDGKMVAVGAYGELIVWDVSAKAATVGFPLNGMPIQPTWAPDGTSLTAQADDRVVSIDAKTGKATTLFETSGVKAGAVAWSPDGKVLAHGGLSGNSRVSFRQGSAPWTVQRTLPSNPPPAGLTFIADGEGLVIAPPMGLPYVIRNISTPQIVPVGFPYLSTAFPGIGRPSDRQAVWLPSTMNRYWEVGLESGAPTQVQLPGSEVLSFSDDGARFLVGSGARGVALHSASDLRKLCEFEPDDRNLRWSEDARYLIGRTKDRTGVVMWDAMTGQQARTAKGIGKGIRDFRLLRDGKRLLFSADSDESKGALACRDIQAEKELWNVEVPDHYLQWALSPDETRLFRASSSLTVRMTGLADGGEMWHRERQMYSAFSGTTLWSGDGKSVFLADRDGAVRVVSAANGSDVRTLHGDGNMLRGIAWLEPGKSVLLATTSGGYCAVDAATGNRIGGAVIFNRDTALLVGPDGHVAAAGGLLEEQVLYVIETDDGGQQTLRPSAFADRFGWKNDPSKARLGWK